MVGESLKVYFFTKVLSDLKIITEEQLYGEDEYLNVQQ